MFVDNKSMCSVNLTSSIKSGARIFLPATKRTPKAREAYAAGLSKQFQTLLLKNNEERITIKDYKDYISQIVKPNIVNIRFIKDLIDKPVYANHYGQGDGLNLKRFYDLMQTRRFYPANKQSYI